MGHLDYITTYLKNSIALKKKLLQSANVLDKINQSADVLVEAYRKGSKVLIAGNGGSAADAQHMAAEFVSRFFYDRPGLPAIAMTTDTSMLTAIGNDYGYDKLFSRQLQAQSQPGDVFIGISTSGNSDNVINAVSEAKEASETSLVLCGEGGMLKEMADIAICVPSSITPYIQECHICIIHILCAIVEHQIHPKDNSLNV